MSTIGGAPGLCGKDEIGYLELGTRADLELHDRERPEWMPLLDVANQPETDQNVDRSQTGDASATGRQGR